jgi:4-hydroxy-3-polyprenylbenzoate decarboxylase
MYYARVTDFLEELERDGELVRVAVEVDPELEITEIVDRVSKSRDPRWGLGGPALLFERVKGSNIPLVINLLGSERRVARALRVADVEELAERIATLVKPSVPDSTGMLSKLKLLPELARAASALSSMPPKIVRSGPCQEVVRTGDEIDLSELPVLKCWPLDAGPFITFGCVFTRNPDSGQRNVGLYRLQVFDKRTTAMHWHPHHDGALNFERYRRRGERMPVAVAIGGDPVYPFMAAAPLPPDTDECLLGGFIRGRPVELVPCKTVELEVPADAEIVLEGYIDPAEPLVTEGPFGDHTGWYSLEDQFPLFHLTTMTHRRNPIYLTTIVGLPPQEDYHMGKAIERIFRPLLRMMIPELVDYDLPGFGVFHNFAFVSIRKEYPHQAKKVMSAIWGKGQLMFTKIIVVVDEEVDVHDYDQVWFAVGSNVHPGRDVIFCPGPTDLLDHAAPQRAVGHKMGIDATRKLPEEGHPRPWPPLIKMSEQVRQLVERRWSEYGIELRTEPGR